MGHSERFLVHIFDHKAVLILKLSILYILLMYILIQSILFYLNFFGKLIILFDLISNCTSFMSVLFYLRSNLALFVNHVITIIIELFDLILCLFKRNFFLIFSWPDDFIHVPFCAFILCSASWDFILDRVQLFVQYLLAATLSRSEILGTIL